MRFKITEPTFFLHKERQAGEIMEAPMGPYRNVATGGGLQRIPQFEEIKDEMQNPFKESPVSVTGVLGLKAKFEAAKARKAAIEDRANKAVSSYSASADMAESAIKSLEDDAKALQAEVAGFTNGAPE